MFRSPILNLQSDPRPWDEMRSKVCDMALAPDARQSVRPIRHRAMVAGVDVRLRHTLSNRDSDWTH